MTGTTKRTVVCLELSAWPAQDQLAWAAVTRQDDPLDEPGRLAHLKPISLAKLRSGYGRWLWHVTVNEPAMLTHAPGARVTRERVADYVTTLSSANAPVTVAHRILSLEQVVRAFAPAGDWRWLRRLVNRLFLRARPVRDKRARLRPPDEVFAAGLDLMQEAETGTFTSAGKQALAFRDGLLLALLGSRAPRVGNVAAMDIQRHLQPSGEIWILRFASTEMKNGQPFEVPLPRELTAPLVRYLEHWRLVLLDGHAPSSRFWISAFGRPLDDHAIHGIVTRRTKELLGVSIFPHLLRAGLMTETAIRDPKHVGIASTLLSHRAPTESSKPYNLARQHEAARQWQQHVRKLRQAARRRSRM